MTGPDPKTSGGLSDLEAPISVMTENGEVGADERKAQQDFREPATQGRAVANLRLLWEKRRFLGYVAAIGLLLSILIAFLIPNRYDCVARLIPPENPPGLAQAAVALAGGSAGLGTIASQLLAQKSTSEFLVGVLTSSSVQDTLIQKFNLRKVYREPRIEDTRDALARHSSISIDHKNQIVTIVVQDEKPQRAAAMAQTYIDELNRTLTEVSTSSARRERIFLEGRLQTVKQDLEEDEKEFSQYSSGNSAIASNGSKARGQATATLQGPNIAARSDPEAPRQLETDSNARVRALQARVAELEKQLREAGSKDESASPEKGAQGDARYPWVRKLPALGVPYADLYRRTMILETLFDMLTQEYELAGVQEAKGIPTVQVLDRPIIPERKSFPPRPLFVVLGTVLALACGVTWVFGHRMWEQTEPSNPGKALAQEVFYSVRAAMPWGSRSGS
jgi:uncharacterized protein involved in exopolysaccharide biosynthesis